MAFPRRWSTIPTSASSTSAPHSCSSCWPAFSRCSCAPSSPCPTTTCVDHRLYNQLFTMHGTVMMFLFAVPVVEAMGVLLLPNMLGARDLPFPRLSAYAFWAYFVGGLVFFGSIFFGLAPDGGWFMYPPLTSSKRTRRESTRTCGCSASASSRSRRSRARSRSSSAYCARARPACRSTGCRSIAWAMLVFGGDDHLRAFRR